MAPRYPAIPQHNPNDINSMAAAIQAMKQTLEILTAQHGAAADAAVTVGTLPAAVTAGGISLAGPAGADGKMGPPGYARDGDDGDPSFVPGPPGLIGPPGLFIPGRDGEDGDPSFVPGPRGTDGKSGFSFKFNSSRSVVADPTAGFFTYDGGDSTVAISFTDADGNSIPSWILFWATVGTSANRGTLYVFQPGTARFIALRMTGGITNNTTWATMACTLLAANDTWGNGSVVSMIFVPDGIQGAAGAAGQFMRGYDGEDGDPAPIIQPRADLIGFSAKAGAQTGLVTATQNLQTASTEVFDRGGFYNNTGSGNAYAFTPPAGVVYLTASASWDGALTVTAARAFITYIYKNGVNLAAKLDYSQGASQYLIVVTSVFDVANGTDYYQCFIEHQDTVNQNTTQGRFAGVWWP